MNIIVGRIEIINELAIVNLWFSVGILEVSSFVQTLVNP